MDRFIHIKLCSLYGDYDIYLSKFEYLFIQDSAYVKTKDILFLRIIVEILFMV